MMTEAAQIDNGSSASPVAARVGLLVRCGLLAAFVGVAAEVAIHGTEIGRWGLASDLSLFGVSAVSAGALWARWWQDRRINVAFTAAAVTAWCLGQASLVLMRYLFEHPIWPGPAQVGFILFPLLALGALMMRLRRFSWIRRWAMLSDAALLASSLMFVTWELWVRAGVRGSSPFEGMVLVAIPALEIVVGSLALVMYLHERVATGALAAAGCFSLAISDTIVAATTKVPASGAHFVALGAGMGAFVVLALIAGQYTAPYVEAEQRPNVGRTAVVYLPSLATSCIVVLHYMVHPRPLNVLSLGFAVAYVAALSCNQVTRAWESKSYAKLLTGSLAELGATETRLRSLLNDLPQAVVVLDAHGFVREANTGALQMTRRAAADLLDRHFTELLPPDRVEAITELWEKAQAHTSGDDLPDQIVISLAPPADTAMMVEIDVSLPLRDPQRVVITLTDVTSTLEWGAALDLVRERFRLAFHDGPTGMALATAPEGRLIDANAAFASMLMTTVGELVGQSIRDVTHPDDWEPNRLLASGSGASVDSHQDSYKLEKRYVRTDGSIVWARTWVSLLDEPGGERLMIAHIEDITEQRQAAEQLRWAATHDELTLLPNRARFSAELTARLSTAPVGTVAVLFIDLDNFKVVNDSLGHAAGDQLLQGMTERLSGGLRGHDMVSRFGGDEFVVMLDDCSPDSPPTATAERLLAEIGRPLVVDGVELFVTGSVGIAVANSPSSTAGDLVRDADAAMYRAKARGRNCVEVFAPDASGASVLALRTASELRRAVERAEIVPYYQPIVDLESGLLTGFEVLARWRHPERGLLGPDQFLPMAEESGLITELGASILRSSLVQLGRWRDRFAQFRELTIAVNVSARQLLGNQLVDIVGEALAEGGVPAGSLWLEITETALMTDVKAATIALRELRSIGLHLSVDDFGTGYSSLTYLKRFPVEAIKIDRSFVNGLGIDAEDTTIVEAVVNLGHSLGLSVVAEGVETPLQLSRLRDLGCDRAQGYLFGRPRPAEIVEIERTVV
jgi:diguanylate cyclase (GGDEF)-like protein/PAS domain S-box-containing protein